MEEQREERLVIKQCVIQSSVSRSFSCGALSSLKTLRSCGEFEKLEARPSQRYNSPHHIMLPLSMESLLFLLGSALSTVGNVLCEVNRYTKMNDCHTHNAKEFIFRTSPYVSVQARTSSHTFSVSPPLFFGDTLSEDKTSLS